MYSCSSSIGLVSSKRKWQRPPSSWAIPKLSAIALGWPRWRYPFGSGGKRVTTSETLPSRTSAATISRMKSRRSGEAGVRALARLSLVISIRVVQYVPARDAEIRRCRSGRGRRQRILGEVDLAVGVLRLVGRGKRLQDVPVLGDLAVGHPERVVERVRGAEQAALADHEDEAALADDRVDRGVDQVAGGQ